MKTIFDLSGLDGILKEVSNGKSLEEKIKEKVRNYHVSAAFRECFFSIPLCGNSYDQYAFEYVACIVALHLKRIYSTKTWKPVKDIYSVKGYKITYAYRYNVFDNYDTIIYEKPYSTNDLLHIESVDTNGNPC